LDCSDSFLSEERLSTGRTKLGSKK
jgi:hypothetical protein